MPQHFAFPYLLAAFLFLIGICHAQTEPAPASPEKKEEVGAKVRILCVQSLVEGEDEVLLATKTEDGKWKEQGALTLRSPIITDWTPVPNGLTHIVRKNGEQMTSLGSFDIKEGLKRAILVMLPDTKRNIYRIQLIDPSNLGFQKGKALVINYANLQAVVKIGNSTKTVAPGKQLIETINADADGMIGLLVGHVDKDKNIVTCYDHKISSDPNTRKFILLFPDPDTGLRAMSLSEFGPFE